MSSIKTMEQLQVENERLNMLAEQDWLTGIYNRGATEQKINQLLSEHAKGVLFLLDIDRFKQINDMYGHLCGDNILCYVAKTLKKMVFQFDIVGRVGGDEFVVFLLVNQDEAFAKERCSQFKSRLRAADVEGVSCKLTVTVCSSLYQPGDDYRSLFDRADMQLLQEKRKEHSLDSASNQDLLEKSLAKDAALIYSELKETQMPEGAFCQDYETFKTIFRYLERRMTRNAAEVCMVLFTLTDVQGNVPSIQNRAQQTELLRHVIQHSLRIGDLFTQYTGFQFLVMVADVNEDSADLVAERIQISFYQAATARQETLLLHHSFPLRPAAQPPKRPSL
ncbi:MAG: GGDEF domain-containing protein [Clostridia bacterium]